MSKPVRIGVIGYGYWGPNLVRNFATNAQLAWVSDLNPARLTDLTKKFPVEKTTTKAEEIFADPTVDAVVIATPVATHRPLAEAALRAGKHVWVEKPLTSTVEDAEALVKLAEEKKKVLFVDHTFVYTPAVRKIRDMVSSNQLGTIHYFDSVRINLGLFQSDTNVAWDLGPHDLSIADFVLQKRPKELMAFGVKHVEGAPENLAYLTLKYDDNLVAHFHFNWLAPLKVRTTIIGGSKKMLVWDDLEQNEKIKVYDTGIDVSKVNTDVEERRRTLISYRTGDMFSPRLDGTEALSAAAREFVSSIVENRAPLTDGRAGLSVVRYLAAAEKSIQAGGKWMPV